MDVNVKGKVVIITGAGGGIGRATALRFEASGAPRGSRPIWTRRRHGRRPMRSKVARLGLRCHDHE